VARHATLGNARTKKPKQKKRGLMKNPGRCPKDSRQETTREENHRTRVGMTIKENQMNVKGHEGEKNKRRGGGICKKKSHNPYEVKNSCSNSELIYSLQAGKSSFSKNDPFNKEELKWGPRHFKKTEKGGAKLKRHRATQP